MSLLFDLVEELYGHVLYVIVSIFISHVLLPIAFSMFSIAYIPI